VLPPFNAYATFGLTDDLTLGIAVFNEYGLAVSWPQGWAGQFFITKSSLTTYDINPTLGFKLTDWFRGGVGIQIIRGVLDIQKALNFVDSQGSVELGGASWGVGADLGVQVDILPKKLLSLGVTYRSRVDLPATGQAHFSNVPTDLQSTLADQQISADFVLPDTLRIGLGTKPMKGLTIDADAIYTAWQTFSALDINFDNPALNIQEAKNWDYVWNIQVGAEYYITDAIPVRLGFVYDPSPASANAATLATLGPDLPDSSRLNFAVGAGYRWKGFYADLGYQFVAFMGATSTFQPFLGSYSGNAQVLGLTVGYKI
jgi:long-chain fatty acid transport protein